MKTLPTLLALVLALSSTAVVACVGNDREADVTANEALTVDPSMLVGRFRFVYTDARRASVESALRAEAKSPEELQKAIVDAEHEASESEIEFAADGVFHSRVLGKEIATAPYAASGASGSMLVLTMRGPSGEDRRTTVRFRDADTIVVDDPSKGELTFRRVGSRG